MCTAIGNSTAGHVAAVAVSGSGATGLDQYASIYTLIAYAGFGLGAVPLFGAPLVNRLMHGVKRGGVGVGVGRARVLLLEGRAPARPLLLRFARRRSRAAPQARRPPTGRVA